MAKATGLKTEVLIIGLWASSKYGVEAKREKVLAIKKLAGKQWPSGGNSAATV